MADETEQKLEAPKVQPVADSLIQPNSIRTKEDEAIWAKMQEPHKLGKHESATHIGLTPEVIAEMQRKGQASKLELFDSAAEEALAALQTPKKDQLFIASNVNSNTPNIEQIQHYQDIQSDSEKPSDEQIALRDDYFTRDSNKEKQDVKQPVKDPLSEKTPLKKFLETDPVTGAAYRSGQSPTLTALVTEMGKRPWTVQAVYDKSATFQDYDAKDSTIHLGTQWTNEKKIDNFGHESYHATHQDLDALFGSEKRMEKDDYLRIKMDQEAGAFLAEFKVNSEFGNKPVTSYEYAEGDKVKHQNIGELVVYKDAAHTVIDEKASITAIGLFLQSHHSPVRNQNGWVERDSWTGQIHTRTYREQHEKSFKEYSDNFNQNRATLLKNGWLGKGY
jgi:hypothetical protein